MLSINDISLRRVLVGHRAAVNVVDFDDKYIVSASGDRTIKVSKQYSSKLVMFAVCHQLITSRQILVIYIYFIFGHVNSSVEDRKVLARFIIYFS